MADETRQLAQFIRGLTYEKIPEIVRARAIALLIDQLGVQIGCSALPWAQGVRRVYVRDGGAAEATVVRYGDRLPVDAAAFINSTFGHSFEYDDGNTLAHGHVGGELIPALIAVGERDHVSGRELLTAFVAGYEVRGRLGWALAPDLNRKGGPQYSATCGPFAVAAAVGRLFGLDAEGIRNAMAVAGCFSGGLAQYDYGGGSAKRIFTAIAASNGIKAAQMAKEGLTGPDEILEGGHGLLHIYAETYRPHVLVTELGEKWVIEHAVLKPYSSCVVIHAAIDGMRKVMATHHLKADDIEAVEVGFATPVHDHAAITAPKDVQGMQYSTSYSLAMTVLKGKNTPLEYTDATLRDPAIAAFASKVSVYADGSLDKLFEGHRPARVKVRTKRGSLLEELIMDARGSKGAPFSKADVDDKFRSQVADVIGGDKCETLLQALYDVATLDDVSKLSRLFVAG